MHRLDDPEENKRILQTGASIMNNRVNGILAITRAFGDSSFKGTTLNSCPVISTPDVTTEIITPTTEFAIIACDGLWDIMTPQVSIYYDFEFITKN